MKINNFFNKLTITKKQAGFTLIEILLTMVLVGFIVGLLMSLFSVAFDTYTFVSNDLFLQRYLDHVLAVLFDGDYKNNGIRDSLEILSASSHSIVFVPLWIDDTHITHGINDIDQTYTLNRPPKPGAGLPIGEVLVSRGGKSTWEIFPVALIRSDETINSKESEQKVMFQKEVPPKAKARFTYHPDVSLFQDVVMSFKLEQGKIVRRYKNDTFILPNNREDGVIFSDFRFQYFDNTNTEVKVSEETGLVPYDQIQIVNGIKVSCTAILPSKIKKSTSAFDAQDNSLKKEGSIFINLRNNIPGGGLIIRQGTKLWVPSSEEIRTLSIANITNFKNGDMIKLRFTNDTGRTWQVNMNLAIEKNIEMIKEFTVEYPAGSTIFKKVVNLPIDVSFDLLAFDSTGFYDYDIDDYISDVVNLEGKVQLEVIRMDAAGATIYMRP